MVGWDPRGTNGSSPVECFTSDRGPGPVLGGRVDSHHPAESEAYQRKTVELARRCGEVSGDLLYHISTADTARDLDALRRLVGDGKLTYVGLSYGTMIGQTYANLFPDRVRAMVLDGIVDAVEYTTSAEARIANNVASADEVFAQFVELCQSAGPGRCALAGHGETVAQRVARLFATARQTPIPAPQRGSARRAQLRRSAARHVQPAAATAQLAAVRGGPRRRRQRRRVGAGDRGAGAANARRVRRRDHVGGDLVRRRSRPPAVHRLARGHRDASPT